eukprot:SAG25_NODE_6086_length_589_cov_2.191837_1_plen_64_part_01
MGLAGHNSKVLLISDYDYTRQAAAAGRQFWLAPPRKRAGPHDWTHQNSGTVVAMLLLDPPCARR